MTIGELFKRAMICIDEYSANGAIRTAEENADYRLRFNRVADMIQKDIATIIKINKSKKFINYQIKNDLNDNFNIYQHLNESMYFYCIDSLAYYFEIDGEATIYIDETDYVAYGDGLYGYGLYGYGDDLSWTNLETIAIPSTINEFTAYKKKITPTNPNKLNRIKFAGSYPYNFKNVAMYKTAFKSDLLVQDWTQYIKHTMPTNFMKLEKVNFTDIDDSYNNRFDDYYWENPTTLLVHRDYKGMVDVKYWAVPTTILVDDTNPTLYDSTELEVLENAQEAMVYGIAGNLLLTETNKRGLATQFINQYEVAKSSLIGIDTVRESLKVKSMWRD